MATDSGKWRSAGSTKCPWALLKFIPSCNKVYGFRSASALRTTFGSTATYVFFVFAGVRVGWKGARKHLCWKALGILLTVHNKEDIQVHDHLCFPNVSSFSVRLAKGDRKHLLWKGLGILLTFGADDKFSVRLGKGTDAFPEERSRPF